MVDILSPDLTEKEKTTMPLILTKPPQPYDVVPATSSQNPQNGTLNNVNNGDLAGISEESATIVKPKSIAQLWSLVERKFEENSAQVTEIKSKIDDTRIDKAEIINEIHLRDIKIEKLEAENSLISGRVHALEKANNLLEQRDRDKSCRVTNVPMEARTTPWQTSLKLYHTLIQPSLELAVTSGELNSVPDCHSLIELAHPMPSNPGKPTVSIVKFISRNMKLLFLRYKGPVLTRIREERGIHVAVYDDLTSTNLACLNRLYEESRVEKAWNMQGKIKFTTKLDPNKVLTVADASGKLFTDMLAPPRPRATRGGRGDEAAGVTQPPPALMRTQDELTATLGTPEYGAIEKGLINTEFPPLPHSPPLVAEASTTQGVMMSESSAGSSSTEASPLHFTSTHSTQ